MRAVMRKLWFRGLMLALFCLGVTVAVPTAVMFRSLLMDGWYAGDVSFEQTGMCQDYVSACLSNAAANLSWLEEPQSTELGGWGGKAFSYVVADAGTGDILADTRTERSRHVLDYPLHVTLEDGRTYDISGFVNLPVEPYEGCYTEYYIFQHVYPVRNAILPAAILGAVLAVVSLVLVHTESVLEGRRGDLTLLGRVPFDLLAVLLVAAAGLGLRLVNRWMNRMDLWVALTPLGVRFDTINTVLTLWGLAAAACCLADQVAAKVFRKRLLLRWIILQVSPMTIMLGVLAANIAGVLWGLLIENSISVLVVLFDLALIPCAVRWGLEAKRIRSASAALAAGDLHYKVDADKLHMVWKDLGRDLNSIGDGMALAVEEQMRSERMKTELITNVSHDLKTPLTSIVNYVQLLKEPDLPEQEREEYLEVLDRQSAKLKKLTTDVVEASRAASGAVTVNAEVFDVRELLAQTAGEYTERMKAAGIEPVLHLPEGERLILADPRLLGRVLDNLAGNVLKYAQPGTRAYFDLEADGEQVSVALKNTSRAPLDIPADELMERFVRGDSSRSTEGSGLGLSIARSLTDLMGGQLRLTLDGDLFKAEILFPPAEPTKGAVQPSPPEPETE